MIFQPDSKAFHLFFYGRVHLVVLRHPIVKHGFMTALLGVVDSPKIGGAAGSGGSRNYKQGKDRNFAKHGGDFFRLALCCDVVI
jgi:hypothetical protein